MNKLITFVCNGNIERSVVAEALFRRWLKEKGESDVEVISRGTFGVDGTHVPRFSNLTFYDREFQAGRLSLQELDLDVSDHVAKRIEQEDVDGADVIVAMAQDTLETLQKRFPEAREKMKLFGGVDDGDGVPDGYGSGEEEYHRAIIMQIDRVIRNHGLDLLKNRKDGG